MRHILVVIIFLMFVNKVGAAPNVTNVSGTFTDGQTVTVSGSGFGANAAVGTSSLEFLGGAGGPIESGTTGATFTRSNWDADWGNNDGLDSFPKKIATDQIHSGSKSLKGTTNSSLYNATMSYQLPVATDTFFMSYWVRHDNQTTDGQWKMLRLSTAKTIVDGSAVAFFNWHSANATINDTIGGSKRPCVSGEAACYVNTNIYPQADNNWYRMDYWINGSTYTVTRWIPGSTRNSTSISGWTDHTWYYAILQDYTGNGSSSNAAMWHDDILVQIGTQARIELCNANTYASSNHCEIQYPTSWNNTTMNIKFNPGSFSSGTAYLYVIDASGNVSTTNSNSTITFGGGSSTPSPVNNVKGTVTSN